MVYVNEYRLVLVIICTVIKETQNLPQRCAIDVTASLLGGAPAFITAQGRDSNMETTGFVFKSSTVIGTGPAFLGRAYRKYSTVLFYTSSFADIVAKEGWSAWNFVGQE